MSYEFSIPGPAVPQGRPRLTTIGGRPRAYDPPKSREYKRLIQLCFAQAHGEKLNEPVRVHIDEVRAIPKSWSKRKRDDAIAGHIRPVTRPDLDNIAKAVLDALNGMAWEDDAQATTLILRKFYGETPHVNVKIESDIISETPEIQRR